MLLRQHLIKSGLGIWPCDATATGWNANPTTRCQFQPDGSVRGKWDEIAKNFFTPSRLTGRGFFVPATPNFRTEKTGMSKKSGFMKALKCRECGREYPLGATPVSYTHLTLPTIYSV